MNSKHIIQTFDRNAPWLVAFAYMAFLCAVAPLRTAFEFGADEGYELMKSLLLSRGYHLYSPIWDDQPPLFTMLLACIFQVFGPTALAARLLVVFFSGVLVGSLYTIVRYRAGVLAAAAAAVLIIASSNFMELSISAITELPAMAAGLLSVAVLLHHYKQSEREVNDVSGFTGGLMGPLGSGDGPTNIDPAMVLLYSWWKHNRCLVSAGVLFGFALQIKFTSAIFCPVIVTEIFLATVRPITRSRPHAGLDGAQTACRASSSARRSRYGARDLLVWGGGALGTVGALAAAFWRTDAWSTFTQAHFSETLNRAMQGTGAGYLFSLDYLRPDYSLCLAAIIGGGGWWFGDGVGIYCLRLF